MKKKFTIWYANEITKELETGQPIDQINITLKLTALKSLHAKWMIYLYSKVATRDGEMFA